MSEMMTKGEVDLSNIDIDDPRITLKVQVVEKNMANLKITAYKNDVTLGSAVYGNPFEKTYEADQGDVFKFVCTGMTGDQPKTLTLKYNIENTGFDGAVNLSAKNAYVTKGSTSTLKGTINYMVNEKDENGNTISVQKEVMGSIGTLECYI
jgi:hypothetical protein